MKGRSYEKTTAGCSASSRDPPARPTEHGLPHPNRAARNHTSPIAHVPNGRRPLRPATPMDSTAVAEAPPIQRRTIRPRLARHYIGPREGIHSTSLRSGACFTSTRPTISPWTNAESRQSRVALLRFTVKECTTGCTPRNRRMEADVAVGLLPKRGASWPCDAPFRTRTCHLVPPAAAFAGLAPSRSPHQFASPTTQSSDVARNLSQFT